MDQPCSNLCKLLALESSDPDSATSSSSSSCGLGPVTSPSLLGEAQLPDIRIFGYLEGLFALS